MTDAQTEARAIALDVYNDAVDSDDGSHSMDMNVATDIIATALAAKDAELATLREADGNFWVAVARAERAEAEMAATKADRDDWIDRCRASVMAFDEQKARAERAEAQLAEANRKIAERDKALANYDRWLNGRDAYIVQKGLWQNFVASLPGSPTARRALGRKA